MHAAGLSRIPGGAGLPSASAEAAGGVKRSPPGPSAANCVAVLLTPADVRSLVLLSGYYFPSLRADVLASLPSASPIIGDLLSYTVAPLLGRAMRSWVFRKLFAPAAVPSRFQAEFPTELSLRPSQLKASAVDTVSMTPSAAALAARYGELKMPI